MGLFAFGCHVLREQEGVGGSGGVEARHGNVDRVPLTCSYIVFLTYLI